MSKAPLYEAMCQYINSHLVHFDVPGHKRNIKEGLLGEFMAKHLYELDISSAKPVDFIGNPTGPLKEASSLMANAFSSEEAFFLINGTTIGVEGMILSQVGPKEKIILPRNVHKSAMNALILSGAEPIYMAPEVNVEWGISHGVTRETVKQTIYDNGDAKSIMVLNPSYYGVVSPLEEIVTVAHSKNMLVMVDEAHGGHFYFHEDLPTGGMEIGCDLSAVSLHKTCGSLTQSSILLAHRKRVDVKKMAGGLDLLQSTSPSYLLLGSLDVTRCFLEEYGRPYLEKAMELAAYGKKQIAEIGGYEVLGKEHLNNFQLDPTKLTVRVNSIGLTGMEVYDILRDEYKVQIELGELNTILAIVTIGDEKEDIDALVRGLKDIKAKYGRPCKEKMEFSFAEPKMILSPREAYYANKSWIPFKEAAGEISGEFVMMYPPGIPIVAPGEKITQEMIEYVDFLKTKDTVLTGMEDSQLDYIYILGN